MCFVDCGYAQGQPITSEGNRTVCTYIHTKELAHVTRRLAEDALVNAERIDLIDVERGKHFRIVADVLADRWIWPHYLLMEG